MQRLPLAFSAVLLGFALFCPSLAAADERIGAAVAVRNQVTTSHGGGALAVGNPVFQNDRISTGANAVAQLMFTDQTTLSIGPRSQITLDRYVYEPNQSVGDVAISLATGAMRFISGAQDPHTYQVNTPVAAVGVRGTIVDLIVLDGRMFGILDEGRTIFTLRNGQTIELDRPGTAVEFFSDGSASRPFTWRGSYESSLGGATFPLFGNPFADFPGLEGANTADDATNRTDDLNAAYTQGQ